MIDRSSTSNSQSRFQPSGWQEAQHVGLGKYVSQSAKSLNQNRTFKQQEVAQGCVLTLPPGSGRKRDPALSHLDMLNGALSTSGCSCSNRCWVSHCDQNSSATCVQYDNELTGDDKNDSLKTWPWGHVPVLRFMFYHEPGAQCGFPIHGQSPSAYTREDLDQPADALRSAALSYSGIEQPATHRAFSLSQTWQFRSHTVCVLRGAFLTVLTGQGPTGPSACRLGNSVHDTLCFSRMCLVLKELDCYWVGSLDF